MEKGIRGGPTRYGTYSYRAQHSVDDRRTQRWVTVAEVAEMLSITKREVYYMVEAGEIPGIKLGRAVRIPLRPLEEWIADKEAEANDSRRAYGSKARIT